MIDPNIVTQICFVTDRLDDTAEWLEGLLGIPAGPVVVAADPGRPTQHLGEKRGAGARTRSFALSNIVLELLEPNEEPSTWRDFLRRNGPGVHHIAFRSTDLEASGRNLEAHGLARLQSAQFVDGTGAYAVFDSARWLGTFIEIFEAGRQPASSGTA